MSKLPPEEVARRHDVARRIASQGGHVGDLAKELGLSMSSAFYIALDAHADLARRPRTPIAKVQQVLDLAKQGATRQEIVDAAGVTLTTTTTWCREAGVPLTKGRGVQISTATFDVIAEVFHHPEQTDTEISRKVGCTRERVGQVRATLRDKQIVKL